MKLLNTILVSSLFLTSVVAQNDQDKLNAKIDAVLSTVFSPEQPGGTVLVAQKGEVVYKQAFGKANLELDVDMHTDQVFKIASNTKPFTAVAILKLAEEGKLSLDDDISLYFDNLNFGEKVTIEHLLTHTSGIFNYTNLNNFDSLARKDYSTTAFMDLFKDKSLDFKPGSSFKYCNSSYELLGLIIVKVTGKTFAAYLQDVFFTPLGMHNTYCVGPQAIIKNNTQGYLEHRGYYIKADYLSETFETSSAGGLRSTVSDLYTWYTALMQYEIISQESMEKSITPYTLIDGESSQTGYSWFLGNLLGSSLIWHEGSTMGYYSSVHYFPEEDIFIAALTNCNWKAKALNFAYAGQKIASILLQKEYFNLEKQPNAVLYPYEGIYDSDTGKSMTLIVSNEQFTLTTEDDREVNLSFYRDDLFHVEGFKGTIQFKRDINQQIIGFYLNIASTEYFELTEKELPKNSFAQELVNVLVSKSISEGKEWAKNNSSSKRYYINEDELNQAGYALLQADKMDEAIVAFELNTELHPKSSNTFDSLGEAYYLKKDFEKALIYYRTALELNPNNENAQNMINEIEQK